MVASAERPLRMLVVHDNLGAGFFIALVPAHLRDEQVEAALRELGIEAEAMFELGGWRRAKCSVAVAHVPFPRTM